PALSWTFFEPPAADADRITVTLCPEGPGRTMSKKEKKQAAKRDEATDQSVPDGKLKRKEYEAKLDELHMELVKMQYWIKATGKKLVVLFEGRDAAGKGGAIKCISEPLNPRGCRIV